MHKLVILIEMLEDGDTFEDTWPQFLHLVERMPGLRRETTSRVEHFMYGPQPIAMVHELYFDTLAAAQEAMASSYGRAAGRLLQGMTGGHMALFFADHNEDDLENIRKYKNLDEDLEESGDKGR